MNKELYPIGWLSISKTEKFLVIKGKALFKFKHIVTDEYYELFTDGEESRIVETVPILEVQFSRF